MTFWIIAIALALLSLAPLAVAMRRARGLSGTDESRADIEVKLYKDQLSEVDRDEARGVLSAEDAKRTRLEISRRLLEADKARAGGHAQRKRTPIWAAGALVVVLLGGGVWLYSELGLPMYQDLPLQRRIELAAENRATRPTQAEMEAQIPATPSLEAPDERLNNLLLELRKALETRPDDLQGHVLLVRNEAGLGNFKAAYEAQADVLRIKGDAATASDYAEYADLMIMAANGYVSPEAEQALTNALRRDPNNATSIYYSGLMFAQTGRPDMTFKLWQPLLAGSEPTDPWVPPIRAQIEMVAQAAGIRYTLPPLSTSPLAGPTAADIENAADMTPEERMEMIRGMVDGLSARLANEGGSPEEWSRLISSLAMLGETQRAKDIWNEAQVIFGPTPEALAIVKDGAQRAGLIE
ncbi:c-type cytochrome biogenesis protein CcmI [Celeribacter litoreus]|uniref:c-type cytochrome biogenesis protein CcmI n=1 Tax=Celeribacter litoreus TaxID=2876714 RepID=UPI001CC907E5|nr:c-type cytochrome biogenesis protein CcmI [Celeribacter litoreus]MCA0043747.1 c-type cytochrome biogenesis protein CcmI [Celeribacter litoreus]